MKFRRLRVVVYWSFIAVCLAAAFVIATAKDASPSEIFAGLVVGLGGIIGTVPVVRQWLLIGKTDDISHNETSEQRNRRLLIKNVRHAWIEGVLKDALRDAQFDIPLETAPKYAGQGQAYERYRIPKLSESIAETKSAENLFGRLLRVFVHQNDKPDYEAPVAPDKIVKVFDDVSRKLLILGAPGSGKTVLLLQLAERLLESAENDRMQPVPVVLNLSSWAAKRESLRDWVIAELQRPTYGVNKTLAKQLVDTDKLIYLLDGLDELAADHRKISIERINTFMTPGRSLVVCSRIEEYQALQALIHVHTALEIQPLTPKQVENLLVEHIHPETTANILRTLQRNHDIWQEVNKPLFINILISTYRERPPTSLPNADGDTIQQVYQLVIEPYISRQLYLAPQNALFSNMDTRHYLSWMASEMQKHTMTTFYVEGLQSDWLAPGVSKFIYRIMLIVFFGLFCGLTVGLSIGLGIGVLFGLIAGLIGGPIYALSKIHLKRRVALSSSGLFVGVMVTVVFGLFLLLAGASTVRLNIILLGALLFGLTSGITSNSVLDQHTKPNQGFRETLFSGLIVELLFGLVGAFAGASVVGLSFGLSFGLSVGLIGGLNGTLILAMRAANVAKIMDSLEIRIFTLGVGIIASIAFGMIFALFVGLTLAAFLELVDNKLISGMGIGLLFGLVFGLGDAYKQIILRLMLRYSKFAPLSYDKLLYHAKERRIMRQVGGGFIFIHRYILEYFADQWEKKHAPKGTSQSGQ